MDILEKVNEIIALMKDEPNKKDFFPVLQEMDDFFFQEFAGVEEPNRDIYFRYDEDQKIAEIERKMKAFQEHPECCLLEGVKFCEDKLRRFFDKYNLGFVRDFHAMESGTFSVKLSCLITTIDSFHQETATKELKQQFQLDLLKSKGIEVHWNKEMNDNEILATTECMNAIEELFTKELNARILKFELREFKGVRTVNSISFYVKPEVLFEKDWEPYEIVLETKEDTLNANQIGNMYHNCKELYHAYQHISFLKETCVSLVKSLFSDICKMVGFEGKIFHEIEDRCKPIREKNQLIREKEKELGLLMKDSFQNCTKSVSERIKKEVYESLNYDLREVAFTPHNLRMTFSFSTGPNFERLKQLTDEELYQLYDTNNGTIDDENMIVICSERNQKTLEDKMTSLYAGIVITNLDVQNHWSVKMNSIRSFTASLDNLNALLKQS